MNIFFIMEDEYGPDFIKKFFRKKQKEGFFEGVIIKAKKIPRDPRMTRIIKTEIRYCDRIIIMADADGKPPTQIEDIIEKLIPNNASSLVDIIVFTHEIEDWICYSMGIKIKDQKPSEILKHKYNYEKYRLPGFISKIDCKLLSYCASYRKLESIIKNAHRR